ncbi:GNAT family N-acetyltransferase [Dehalogenimonas etheniformans]|uniref:GNAT family N-acetyltransferase n=1 Tax=Dehalogenimonas etheniformans TaxID=1536648 RepID=A0A2P5P888_9CHLR|nr:GNAT family N-acetyltransferase [Dehalogenimonas etheniformans]PPD58499.1 GNAT family N-acetyltransferase [Dehalogenimonas etheniformans]QNT76737.1 GNAT family N-acetyltransferase [Dehalogenimonas etheniformans]
MPAETRFSIKQFVEDELSQLTRLINETIEKSYSSAYPPKAVRFFLDYHARMNVLRDAGAGTILIGWEKKSAVATGTLVGNHVSRVFVGAEYRKRGYGKMIAEELENRARARDLRALELDASVTSRSFWERLGWIVISHEVEMVEDEPLEYFKMKKELV